MNADEIRAIAEVRSGSRLAESTVRAALHRAGLTSPQPRYRKELPWRVKPEHSAEYPARMLRDLGRLRARADMPESERDRLLKWVRRIEEAQCVVAYNPDFGFFYVEATEGDWPDGTPIRPGTTAVPHTPQCAL